MAILKFYNWKLGHFHLFNLFPPLQISCFYLHLVILWKMKSQQPSSIISLFHCGKETGSCGSYSWAQTVWESETVKFSELWKAQKTPDWVIHEVFRGNSALPTPKIKVLERPPALSWWIWARHTYFWFSLQVCSFRSSENRNFVAKNLKVQPVKDQRIEPSRDPSVVSSQYMSCASGTVLVHRFT